MLLFIGLFVLLITGSTRAQVPCQSRDYQNGGTVCVCNADYCDTLPKAERVDPPQFLVYTSNRAGLRLEKTTGTFEQSDIVAENEIRINSTDQYQTMLGWGGAFLDAFGINVKSLDEKAQEHLMRGYFSEDGLEYSLCRVPIGSTDFGTRGYSYDDGDEDEELLNFKLEPEDFDYKIPLIKTALNITNNNLKLFASAWTAPKWMKTNQKFAGLGFIKPKYYQPWAEYYIKFFDSYAENGINFWGVTTQNEPSLAYLPFDKINSNGWLPWQMETWINNNFGPVIRNSKYSDLKIMTIDDQRFFFPGYATGIVDNALTDSYVDGFAVHWYWDTSFPASFLTDTHNAFPTKFILATEACHGNKAGQEHVLLGSWDRGELYANDIIEDVANWVTGWVDWSMGLDVIGGPTYIDNFVDSPIIVNATAGEFYKQPMYYNLAHFTKFVPRGSVRVYSSQFDGNVTVAAFKRPDEGTVVVILNRKEEVVPATVVDDDKGVIQLNLTKKSITTVLYW